ncbi:MAG: choice-of-anchor tandem repeat NxxGxxAF-containing protein [Planctomycetota bacterium]
MLSTKQLAATLSPLVLCGLAAGQAMNPPPQFEVRLESDVVYPSLGLDVSIEGLNLPMVNDAGDAVFIATLRDPNASPQLVPSIVMQRNGQQPEVVAKVGEPAADLPGLTYSSLSDYSLNSVGDVMFRAQVAGPGVLVENRQALFISQGGATSLAAREGQAVAGFDGNFTLQDIWFNTVEFNTNDRFTLYAEVQDTTVPFVLIHGAVLVGDPGGSLEALAIDRQYHPALGEALRGPYFPTVDDLGQVAIPLTYEDWDDAVVLYTPETGLVEQYHRLDRSRNDSSIRLRGFQQRALATTTPQGELYSVWQVSESANGGIVGFFGAIIRSTANNGYELLLRDDQLGDDVPGFNFLGEVNRIDVNATGDIFLRHRIDSLSFDTGWVAHFNSQGEFVFRLDNGDAAPGEAAGVTVEELDGALSDTGRSLITAELAGPGITTANRDVIYLREVSGDFMKVLQRGDTIDVDPDEAVTDLRTVNAFTNPHIVGTDVYVAASFAGGASALLVADIRANPCPADVNADEVLDIDDFSAFVTSFFAGSSSADQNADGELDIDDFSAFVTNFFAGCD